MARNYDRIAITTYLNWIIILGAAATVGTLVADLETTDGKYIIPILQGFGKEIILPLMFPYVLAVFVDAVSHDNGKRLMGTFGNEL